MPIVQPEYLAPAAFLIGLALGAASAFAAGLSRGYGRGLEDGRSGK